MVEISEGVIGVIPLDDLSSGRRLSAAERKVLALLFCDSQVPYVEIAEQMGVPVGSVGATGQRILRRLRVRHGDEVEAVVQEGRDALGRLLLSRKRLA